MASYVRCLCVLFLVFLSLSLQIQARHTNLLNKFRTKKSNENLETMIISPTGSPARAPALEPESEVVEHGYGLYGSEPYHSLPSTTEPVLMKSTSLVGEEKYIPIDELKEKHNFDEFEMGYSNNVNEEVRYPQNHGNGNGNEYVSEKQGVSDTRFLENGNKYYHDVNNIEQGDQFENKYNYNQEYVSRNGDEHENGYNNNGDDEFGIEEDNEEYNYYKSHVYETQERVNSKTLPPNEYDNMEEYEKEQVYKQSQREYVP